MAERNCKTCNKLFVVNSNTHVFCSHKCRNKQRSRNNTPLTKTTLCKQCRKEVVRTGRNQKYCSNICGNKFKYQNGGYQKYYQHIQNKGVGSGGMNKLGKEHHSYKNGIGIFRKLAFEHFSKECMRCKSTKFIVVHHRDYNRTNNKIANLEVLCKRCHQLEHNCIAQLPQYRKE